MEYTKTFHNALGKYLSNHSPERKEESKRKQ
jgi:hypothetical protein